MGCVKMSSICSGCKSEIAFLSKKHKYKGETYCENCYHTLFGRYQYQPLPNKYLNREVSLASFSERFYETDDRVLKFSVFYGRHKVAVHILLYIEPTSDDREKYIGIEISTGRVFEVTEITDSQPGPDGHILYSGVIREISQNEFNLLVSSFSDVIRERFSDFSVNNAKQYLNLSIKNQRSCFAFGLVYSKNDITTIIDSSVTSKFLRCDKYVMSTERYLELRNKYPRMSDVFLSANVLDAYTADKVSGYGLINPNEYRSQKFTSEVMLYIQKIKQMCSQGDSKSLSNFLYFENAGKYVQQTYIDDDKMLNLINDLEKIIKFKYSATNPLKIGTLVSRKF